MSRNALKSLLFSKPATSCKCVACYTVQEVYRLNISGASQMCKNIEGNFIRENSSRIKRTIQVQKKQKPLLNEGLSPLRTAQLRLS